METPAIHRLIELHAAMQPDAVAVVDGESTLTYRELNVRANAFARHLIAHGLRRGAHAVIEMECGATLAIVLLAILKAGASYEWVEPIDGAPGERTIVIRSQRCAQTSAVNPAPSASIPVGNLLATSFQPTPNLPILTRGSDIACVLRSTDNGNAVDVLVPHATLVALRHERQGAPNAWMGEPGALDLWIPLMAGATAATAARTAAGADSDCRAA